MSTKNKLQTQYTEAMVNYWHFLGEGKTRTANTWKKKVDTITNEYQALYGKNIKLK